MEPSGFMDSQTLSSSKGATAKNEKQKQDGDTRYFSLYDVSDEEIHFSLDMLDAKTNTNNFVKHQQYPGFSQLGSLEQPISASYFADVNLNYNHLLPEPRSVNAGAAERVRSSRLLNSIGSKLRRGSNYLVAPKLVGQYLLGITIQSWSEFFNTSRMIKAPTTTQQLTRRLLNNLSYFQGNYLCVSLVLVIYCILTSPLLLLAILAYLVALYMVTARSATGRHMRILNYRPNLQQQYSFITLISIPLLWVAGAPSAVFWVIGASFVVVGLHASMYNLQQQLTSLTSEQQFNEQQQQQQQQVVYSSLNGSNNSVQYYNHYPEQLHHYLSVPTTRMATTQQQQQQTVKETNSYYTNIISHWISGTPTRSSSINQSSPVIAATQTQMPTQMPMTSSSIQNALPQVNSSLPNVAEVKIISQDFAGLGRVYEI